MLDQRSISRVLFLLCFLTLLQNGIGQLSTIEFSLDSGQRKDLLYKLSQKFELDQYEGKAFPDTLDQLGWNYMREGKFHLTQQIMECVFSLGQIRRDPNLQCQALLSLALNQMLTGNLRKGEYWLQLANQIPNLNRKCEILSLLVQAHRESKEFQFDRALEYLNIADSLTQEQETSDLRGYILKTLAATYIEVDQLEHSRECIQRAFEETKNPKWLLDARLDLGKIQKKEGQAETAIRTFP